MPRDLDALAGAKYDLLVIGGGIHGLFAAYDAASRGLSTALVERADFGSGLSFNHQRTLHGGLRAMQSGNIGKVHQQILERRTWARIAPHLLRPLPFLVATSGWTTHSRSAVRVGFAIYDLVGRKRNSGVSPELHLPRAKLESAAATRRLFPGVNERGLSGGAVWYDYQIRYPDRLIWTVALAAREANARLINYVEALGPGQGGVRIRDVISGREAVIDAKTTIVAAGSGMASALKAFGVEGAPPMLRAMNMLLNRPARGNMYVGFRTIDSTFEAHVLSTTINYRMSPKWIGSASASIDFGDSGNLGQSASFTRIGESLIATLGFNFDESKDNFGVSFLVEPRFLPTLSVTRRTGIEIPPVGAYGLE